MFYNIVILQKYENNIHIVEITLSGVLYHWRQVQVLFCLKVQKRFFWITRFVSLRPNFTLIEFEHKPQLCNFKSIDRVTFDRIDRVTFHRIDRVTFHRIYLIGVNYRVFLFECLFYVRPPYFLQSIWGQTCHVQILTLVS